MYVEVEAVKSRSQEMVEGGGDVDDQGAREEYKGSGENDADERSCERRFLFPINVEFRNCGGSSGQRAVVSK